MLSAFYGVVKMGLQSLRINVYVKDLLVQFIGSQLLVISR
jgi:hypothetical protein